MFLNKFKDLLHMNGLNPKQFSEKSNIPYSTVRGWVALGRLPDFDAIIKISNYFDITADELIGRGEKPMLEIKQDNDVALLVNTYKNMSERQKEVLKIYINTLLGKDIFTESGGAVGSMFG